MISTSRKIPTISSGLYVFRGISYHPFLFYFTTLFLYIPLAPLYGVGTNSDEIPEVLNEEITKEPANLEIPGNLIIHSLGNNNVLLGSSIQEIKVHGTKTPELICPNGAVGVFSKGNAEGWDCKAGDTITWSFEKYPLNSKQSQSLAVGFVKEGVMYEAEVHQDMLSATYQLNMSEDGIYHIYFICASSNPISLKEGELQINNI